MKRCHEAYLKPPSANPAEYCRFCCSQQWLKPFLFTESDEALLSRIESLLQIKLHPKWDQGSATCFRCQQKLIEYEVFRERCRKVHEAVRRCRMAPMQEEQEEEEELDGCYDNQGDCSSMNVSVDPVSFIKREEDDVSMEDSLVETEGTTLNETCTQFNATELTVVDFKDVRKNSRFWQVLSRDVESIPKHVRNILELTGRCRQQSLAFISPSTIKRLEVSMRNAVQMLIDHEKLLGNTDRRKVLVKYYGKTHWKAPKRFRFSEEENTTILAISSAVQLKGIYHYLKKAKVGAKQVLGKVDDSNQLAQTLIDKIQKYYQERKAQSDEYQNFIKHLPNHQHIQIYSNSNGTIFAIIRCPSCEDTTKAYLHKNGYWDVYIFIRHCEDKHYRVKGMVKSSSVAKKSESAAATGNLRRSKRRAAKKVDEDSTGAPVGTEKSK